MERNFYYTRAYVVKINFTQAIFNTLVSLKKDLLLDLITFHLVMTPASIDVSGSK